ncbi:biotin/lipoyl-containing protein [Rhizobium alvei]
MSGTMANHPRKLGSDYVAVGGKFFWPLTMSVEAGCASIVYDDGIEQVVTSDWLPGMSHGTFMVSGQSFGVKIAKVQAGWRLRFRGIDQVFQVMTPRIYELSRHMPVKKAADTSKQLLCPMPGVITQVMVKEGDMVEAGQALATVEAMKMENVLKAEKKATIKSVKVEAGQSLAVDEVIMEFE